MLAFMNPEWPRLPLSQILAESQKSTGVAYSPDRGTVTDTLCASLLLESQWCEVEGVGQVIRPRSIKNTPISELYLISEIDFPASASVAQFSDYRKLFWLEYGHAWSMLTISYRNSDAVNSYLACYPEIESFLEAAGPELVRCFEGPVAITLEVITYTGKTTYEELVGWIQSSDDIDEGLRKLERFEDEWFLDHLDEVGSKFNFNIETK